MIKVILLSIGFILFILGLTDFIHFVIRKTLIDKREIKNAKIVILNEENATSTLRFYVFEKNWYGKTFGDKIIAITDNLSNETVERCYKTVEGSGIILIPKEFLCDVISTVF